MKKFLITFLLLFINLIFIENSIAFDCTTACRKHSGVRDVCLKPVGPKQAPVYEKDIHGSSAFHGFIYCDCKCGGYAGGGIVREIGPCSIAKNTCN
jgi:hypothetical protein